MKLFFTLIQRVAALAVVLVLAFGLNATNRTFATIKKRGARLFPSARITLDIKLNNIVAGIPAKIITKYL